jgi:hypothetical protein
MKTYKVYDTQVKENVKKLFEDGKNKCEISRITGIPRATLTTWIHPRYIAKTNKPRNSYVPIINFEQYLNTEEKRKAYSFILAVYLCDGYISRYKTYRAANIRLFNDLKYQENTKEWAEKLKVLLPENSVNVHKQKSSNSLVVSAHSRKLLDLFPQYGDGCKHNRKLIFCNWQLKIIEEFPEEFIRGCIQSDGCIYTQVMKNGYSYKRFNFINKSEDIIDLFLSTLKLINISKEKYFQVNRGLFVVQNFSKEAVSILEKIISKKS